MKCFCGQLQLVGNVEETFAVELNIYRLLVYLQSIEYFVFFCASFIKYQLLQIKNDINHDLKNL